MLCSKVCILSVNSAEEKEPAVGYLSMRTRQPNRAPFPELLHDEVQKSWTFIYAVQSTAGLENCCQHPGSFWAASPCEMTPQVCGDLPAHARCCVIYYAVTPDSVLQHSVSNSSVS